MKVEPFFGGVRYKKREAIAPQFVSFFRTKCTLQRILFKCLIVLIIGCPIILSGDVLFNLEIVSESVGHGSVV
jgi:hypothetical protein